MLYLRIHHKFLEHLDQQLDSCPHELPSTANVLEVRFHHFSSPLTMHRNKRLDRQIQHI